MAFTVISLAANLRPEELIRALEASPEFVESDVDYLTLLSQTGWRLLESQDLSLDYAASTRRQLKAMKENQQSLIAVIGESDYADRYKKHTSKVLALHDGVLRRELFVVTPA